MAEQVEPPSGPARARTTLLWIGGAGLLTAMATDAVAVLGRHVGFAVPGSIEIFQMAAVVALSCAILLASIDQRHASVDLLFIRASERVRYRLHRAGSLALAITFALIFAGSAWIVADLWPTHEVTEVLALPVAPFRLIWTASAGAAALYFAISLVRAPRP